MIKNLRLPELIIERAESPFKKKKTPSKALAENVQLTD